jgi:hypothetical protein
LRQVLTLGDLQLSWHVGMQRSINAIVSDADGAYGGPDAFDPANVIGAIGELSVSKAFNLAWVDHTLIGGVDVGGLVDARASRKFPIHGLVVHDENKDRPFVLVDLSPLPKNMYVELVGWAHAKDVKARPKTHPQGTRVPDHWMPLDLLKDVRELRSWCHCQLVLEPVAETMVKELGE